MKSLRQRLETWYIEPNGGSIYADKKIDSLCELVNEWEQERLSDYSGLCNVVDAFVDLEQKHPLWKSIRQDVKNYLNIIKNHT